MRSMAGWLDAWPEVHGLHPGYTYDGWAGGRAPLSQVLQLRPCAAPLTCSSVALQRPPAPPCTEPPPPLPELMESTPASRSAPLPLHSGWQAGRRTWWWGGVLAGWLPAQLTSNVSSCGRPPAQDADAHEGLPQLAAGGWLQWRELSGPALGSSAQEGERGPVARHPRWPARDPTIGCCTGPGISFHPLEKPLHFRAVGLL